MSTLKVNEIEDYSGNTVTIKDNTVIEGANNAAKNLTVSGTATVEGNLTSNATVKGASVTVANAQGTAGTLTAGTVAASTTIVSPSVVISSNAGNSIQTPGGINVTGSGTFGSLTVGGLALVQYLKAFGVFTIADPTTDKSGNMAPDTGSLNLASTGTYDYDSANDKMTFTCVFSSALQNANYLVLPFVGTEYAALFRTKVTTLSTTQFVVEIIYTNGTAPTNSQEFQLHVAVLQI